MVGCLPVATAGRRSASSPSIVPTECRICRLAAPARPRHIPVPRRRHLGRAPESFSHALSPTGSPPPPPRPVLFARSVPTFRRAGPGRARPVALLIYFVDSRPGRGRDRPNGRLATEPRPPAASPVTVRAAAGRSRRWRYRVGGEREREERVQVKVVVVCTRRRLERLGHHSNVCPCIIISVLFSYYRRSFDFWTSVDDTAGSVSR